MDPGLSLLQHIKTIPNLINEDPSITTPKNTAFVDRPWSELSKLLADRKEASSSSSSAPSSAASTPATEHEDDMTMGAWDYMTGYQDTEHQH
ncbi:hypothetical protein BCR43DRAFT_481099 [Syncephalastrum racemosum]|uniref:Uncharacterized protein n=1 Tax=Syncephalastrum racemosum TaxID=13706 RepID=A0A1X2HRF0_SYNRA|nr:hypothetical protein BCR43DRAFT_481099 [Syncephalastrum racemosum]